MEVDSDSAAETNQNAHANNKFARPTGVTATHSATFNVPRDKDFNKQYAAVYFTRLTKLKSVVLARAQAEEQQQGGESAKLCQRILDIIPDQRCIVAGTLYKEQKLKPCILDEYNKEKAASLSSVSGGSNVGGGGERYMSDDDSLVLEDEFGRVSLSGPASKLPVRSLVSGVVVALAGREVEGGRFEVDRVFVPGLAPQQQVPRLMSAADQPPAYLLCVSGLSMGAPGVDPLPVQLLLDYITGMLGSGEDHRASASIVRVLILGNSLHRFEKKRGKEFQREEIDPNEVSQPLKELDMMLTQLAAAVPVDVMPGETDPSTFTLPQQPLHKCLFPSAATYSSFSTTTNPCSMQIHGLEVLATAGQNLNDLAKYCDAPSPIDYMESCLQWRNVAPTAPDTLGCYPFQQDDPFVLTSCPHLYLVGNQHAYASRLVRGSDGQISRALTVPSFASTRTAVLINLNSPTLDTQSMKFDVQQ